MRLSGNALWFFDTFQDGCASVRTKSFCSLVVGVRNIHFFSSNNLIGKNNIHSHSDQLDIVSQDIRAKRINFLKTVNVLDFRHKLFDIRHV